MLSGIERISAKEIPSIGIAAPDHTLIPFPAVTAQPVEVFFHELFRLIFVLKHRGKFLQQFGFTVFSLAFGFGKCLFELLQFFALFGLFPPSPLPVRAFRVRYRYPVATVVIYLCREKVHFTPPRFNSAVQTAVCSYSGKENIPAVPFAIP